LDLATGQTAQIVVAGLHKRDRASLSLISGVHWQYLDLTVLYHEHAQLNRAMILRRLIQFAMSLWAAIGLPAHCFAQFDIEEPPIAYSTTQDNNRVTDLLAAIKSGDTSLENDRQTGYLRSLLKALEIPVSSQTLVFSKTSMQITYISPRTPRAIYFNDDTYVGWVQGSSLMEISTNDPKLGAAFYTVRMSPGKPRVKREFYNCLACHTSTMTQGVPGHTVRSVMPTPDGTIDVQRESFVTDHTSPLSERWGGWYVTGKHGDMQHMGNAVLRGDKLFATGKPNRARLQYEFYTDDWLSPYSDIVALMVLEHQTQMQNAFTVADFTVRQALFEHRKAYGVTGKSPDAISTASDDVKRELTFTIKQAAKKVVDYMLFVNEAPLTSQIESSSSFAKEFTARGPADSSSRSLRDFDLQHRMFKFPCSYLVYSPAFESLEPELRDAIYRQLWEVLTGNTSDDECAHLNAKSRHDILEILRATKKGLPSYWTVSSER